MRVLLVSTDVLPTPPERYGGNERVVDLLARVLVEAGHTVGVVALDAPAAEAPYTRFPIPMGTDPVAHFAPDWWDQWDIVHDHGWRLVSWRLARQRPDRTWYMTWHGPRIDDAVGWFPAVPPNLRIAGLTPSHALSLQAVLGVPVAVTPNAVDLRQYPLYPGARTLPPLVLARLDPAKGQHLAMALAQAAGMDLLLAGNEHLGPDGRFSQAIITHADGRRVTWLGDIGGGRKLWFLSQTTAVLWPVWGYEEPFGLGVVEALAVGTPVLALAHGGLGDLLGWRSPLVFPSLSALAAALQRWPVTRSRLPDPVTLRSLAGQWSPRRMQRAYEALWAAG